MLSTTRRLRSRVFQKIEVFGFSIGCKGAKCLKKKSLNTGNSKFKKFPMWFYKKHCEEIQDKFENVWL